MPALSGSAEILDEGGSWKGFLGRAVSCCGLHCCVDMFFAAVFRGFVPLLCFNAGKSFIALCRCHFPSLKFLSAVSHCCAKVMCFSLLCLGAVSVT